MSILEKMASLDAAAAHPERAEVLQNNIARRERSIAARREEIEALRASGNSPEIEEEIAGIEEYIKDFQGLNERDRESLKVFEATK